MAIPVVRPSMDQRECVVASGECAAAADEDQGPDALGVFAGVAAVEATGGPKPGGGPPCSA